MDDRGPQLMVVLILFFLLSLITVSLRCYTMGFILKRFFVEDYLAVLALLLYITYATMGFISIGYGLGKHEVEVLAADRPTANKYAFIAAVLYEILSYLVKVIVGLFLLRICSASHQKWQRISIRAMLIFVGVFYAAYFVITLLACQPTSYIWERYGDDPPEGKCNSSAAAFAISYIATVLNCVADWMLAILPATVVWKAKLDMRTKISISILLGIGSIASIATIVRVFYADELVEQGDYLYDFVPFAIWSTIEVGMALTASSLATLKPLFRKLNVVFHTTRNSSFWHSGGVSSARRRMSSKASGARMSAAPHKRQSHYNSTMYGPRKGASPDTDDVSITLPIQARWHYNHCNDEIEMVPASPTSDGTVGSRKAVYYQKWEESMV